MVVGFTVIGCVVEGLRTQKHALVGVVAGIHLAEQTEAVVDDGPFFEVQIAVVSIGVAWVGSDGGDGGIGRL